MQIVRGAILVGMTGSGVGTPAAYNCQALLRHNLHAVQCLAHVGCYIMDNNIMREILSILKASSLKD